METFKFVLWLRQAHPHIHERHATNHDRQGENRASFCDPGVGTPHPDLYLHHLFSASQRVYVYLLCVYSFSTGRGGVDGERMSFEVHHGDRTTLSQYHNMTTTKALTKKLDTTKKGWVSSL